MTRHNVVEHWSPRKILYRGIAFELFPEVLGTPSGSGRILSQGRDRRRKIRGRSPDIKAPSMKKYPSLKPAIWGAVVGAAAISVIGFSSFGWTLGSTAERMAKEQAQNAVVAVLAPICVEKFQHQADAATKLIEFKKVSSSWERRSIIEKGGWATVAGTGAPSSAVLTACADRLGGPL